MISRLGKIVRAVCPHVAGWSYNTHRRRRWCYACAQQQRLDRPSGRWIDVP